MKVDAYPLAWPSGWPRTPDHRRKDGKFHATERQYSAVSNSSWRSRKPITIAEAVARVRAELQRFGFDDDDIVISSNLELRLDGLPKSGQRQPEDAGVAVYWRDGTGAPKVMAIDLYRKVEHNLAAVAATIEAMRAIERHGGAQILNRAFAGFKALPASGGSTPTMDVQTAARVVASYFPATDLRTPHDVLTIRDHARAAIRFARAKVHPDVAGGDAAAWENVETARAVLEAHHGGAL